MTNQSLYQGCRFALWSALPKINQTSKLTNFTSHWVIRSTSKSKLVFYIYWVVLMSHCETFTYHTTQNIHLYLPLYKLPLNTLLHQPILQQYHFKYFYTFLDLQPFCFWHINYQPWYTMLIYIRVFIDFFGHGYRPFSWLCVPSYWHHHHSYFYMHWTSLSVYAFKLFCCYDCQGWMVMHSVLFGEKTFLANHIPTL